MMRKEKTVKEQWFYWLTEKSFPLWATVGFDKKIGLYEEALTFERKPALLPRRLMVQMRQVAVYCKAERNGHYKAGAQALEALHQIEKYYYHRDGHKGWIFSIFPDGSICNNKRDLYAHAFVLYAYAWAYKFTKDEKYLKQAKKQINEIEDIFSDHQRGFYDTIPPLKETHCQDPNLHLFESHLILFDITQDEFFLEKADKILALILEYFIPKKGKYLLEFLNKNWKPVEKEGLNHVQPGHQIEWCWLLSKYHDICCGGRYHDIAMSVKQHLLTSLIQDRLMEGKLFPNAIFENGRIKDSLIRIWPQTEKIRFIADYSSYSLKEKQPYINEITRYFFKYHALEKLQGGWYDGLNSELIPVPENMPASALYHIYNAAITLLRPRNHGDDLHAN